MTSRGARRDAKHVSDLLERQLRAIAQVEDLPLPRWQLVDLAPDGDPVRRLAWHRLSTGTGQEFHERRDPPAQPVLVHRASVDRPVGPAPRILDLRAVPELDPQAEEHLLYGIGRLGI